MIYNPWFWYFQVFFIVGSAVVGGQQGKPFKGLLLGLFLGPIGFILSFMLGDNYACGRCGTKLNGKPQICPACHTTVDYS